MANLCSAKIIGERMPVGSRGVARQAIFMVQTAQNRRRGDLRVFRKAMTGGHELIRFGQRMWNARSQAGVWTTSVIVRHPFAKDPSEMCLVNRDQPIETLPTHRADQSLAEGVGLRCPRRGLEHMPPHRPDRLVDDSRIDAVPIVEDEPVGRLRGDDRAKLLDRPRRRGMLRHSPERDHFRLVRASTSVSKTGRSPPARPRRAVDDRTPFRTLRSLAEHCRIPRLALEPHPVVRSLNS